MYKSIINGVFPATKPLEALLARDGATEPIYYLSSCTLQVVRCNLQQINILKALFDLKSVQ